MADKNFAEKMREGMDQPLKSKLSEAYERMMASDEAPKKEAPKQVSSDASERLKAVRRGFVERLGGAARAGE